MIQALAMSEQEEKEKQKEQVKPNLSNNGLCQPLFHWKIQDLVEKMIQKRLELQKVHFQQLQEKQERLAAEQVI